MNKVFKNEKIWNNSFKFYRHITQSCDFSFKNN